MTNVIKYAIMAQLAEKVKFFGASTDAKKLLDKAEMKTGNIALRSGEAVKKLLDKTDSGAENVKIADKLLNQEETRRVVVDVKTSTLLDQAESYLKIGEIIEQKKDEEERSNSYILGPDDQVQISVQDHPELSGKTTVGPDGMVILPLVNQPVKAQGFTVDEFNDSVKNALKKYVKDPVCYVGIVRESPLKTSKCILHSEISRTTPERRQRKSKCPDNQAARSDRRSTTENSKKRRPPSRPGPGPTGSSSAASLPAKKRTGPRMPRCN